MNCIYEREGRGGGIVNGRNVRDQRERFTFQLVTPLFFLSLSTSFFFSNYPHIGHSFQPSPLVLVHFSPLRRVADHSG
jgi:hypothetical protein